LSNLGRGEEALVSATEAVDIYRRLAQVNPAGFELHLYRRSAEVAPDVYLPDLTASLETLAGRLVDLAQDEKALSLAEEAVHLGRRLAHNSPIFLPSLLSNLGAVLQARYRSTGSLSDLDRAASFLQEAISTAPPDHPNRAAILSNLGAVLQARYRSTGSLSDLDRAASFLQEAISTAPPDHPNRAVIQSNLAMLVLLRTQRS